MLIEIILWGAGLVAAYVVLGGLAVALGIGWLLTPGRVDWAGENRPAPADPETIGYRGDPASAFGYRFETVTYSTELGPAEAWLVPATAPSDLWAIFVHGVGGLRENGYRQLRVLHEAGVPVLLMTYRNDRGAPAAPDRLFSFGLTEWRDLEAAVAWTAGQGADRVLLVAESMGAAIVGQYLARATDTARVAGLALDAPALDFAAVIRVGLRHYRVPLGGPIASLGLWLSGLVRSDLRLAVSTEAIVRFAGPLFIAHGARDPLVPVGISDGVAAARPGRDFLRTGAREHLHSFADSPTAYREGLLRLVEAASSRPLFSASRGG